MQEQYGIHKFNEMHFTSNLESKQLREHHIQPSRLCTIVALLIKIYTFFRTLWEGGTCASMQILHLAHTNFVSSVQQSGQHSLLSVNVLSSTSGFKVQEVQARYLEGEALLLNL